MFLLWNAAECGQKGASVIIQGSQNRLLALMARERLARYAGGRLGPAWAILTPIAWIAFVVILFRALDRSPSIHVGPEIFVATGVLPYISFRQAVTSMSRAYPAHRYLRYIRPVSMSDILFATILLEALNMIFAALLIFAAVTVLFGADMPDNIPLVAMGIGLAWWLAAGLGRLVAVLGLLSDSFARSVPILLRPLFWVSGIFYTATELPASLQSSLWYSPLLHVTELVRTGYFASYTSPIATPWLPIGVAAALFLASFTVEQHALKSRSLRYRL